MLKEFTDWLLDLIGKAFTAVWDWFTDVLIELADLLLTAMASLIALIPVPDWLSAGMQALFQGLDGPILYILSSCGFGPAVALYGAGWGVRLVRKIVTLFQW